jgi:hypothetical protein
MIEATMRWSDLMEFETVPVIQTEEVMKLAKTPIPVLPGVEMKL